MIAAARVTRLPLAGMIRRARATFPPGSLQSLQNSTATSLCALEQKRESLMMELAQCNQQV
jgi:hypothetical protein